MLQDQTDKEYLMPYIFTKGKYMTTKKWMNQSKQTVGDVQNGGVTDKSGDYLVLFNSAELDEYLRINNKTRQSIGIGNEARKLTGGKFMSFVSVDTLRTILGKNGYFVKEGSNRANPVIKPSILFKMVKYLAKLPNGHKLYEVIAKLVNKKKQNGVPEVTAEKVKEMVDHPVTLEFQLAVPLRFSRGEVSEQLKNDVQSIADQINKKNNTQIDSAFFVNISRVARNELLAEIHLNPVQTVGQQISQRDIAEVTAVTNTIDPSSVKSATAVMTTEMDTENVSIPSTQGGGFFHMEINESDLLGGGKESLPTLEVLIMTVAGFIVAMLSQP